MRMDDLFAALEEVKAAEQDVAMAASNAEKAAAKKKLEKKKAEAKKIKERVEKLKRNFQAQQTRKMREKGKAAAAHLSKMRASKKAFEQSMARHHRSVRRESARADPEMMMDVDAMGFEGPSSKSYRPVMHARYSRSKRRHPYLHEHVNAPRTMTSYVRHMESQPSAANANEMLGGRRRALRNRRTLRNRRSRNRKH